MTYPFLFGSFSGSGAPDCLSSMPTGMRGARGAKESRSTRAAIQAK
jgi:hypothetical protein